MKDWAENLNSQVLDIIQQADQIGDHENAHIRDDLPKHLIKHLKWLPSWSGICRDKFGFGRIPATSAEIESIMNDIKNRVFSNYNLPMRPDLLIPILVKYFDGNCKIQISQSVKPVLPKSVDSVNLQFTQCPACSNGDFPTGAHKLVSVFFSIHKL